MVAAVFAFSHAVKCILVTGMTRYIVLLIYVVRQATSLLHLIGISVSSEGDFYCYL